jgi:hypothetical protein
MKTTKALGMGLLLLSASACVTASTNRVHMSMLNSALAQLSGIEGDPLAKEPVEYQQVGKSDYDQFFRDSSTVRANLVVADAYSDSLSKNVKRYAQSYAAAHATDDAVKEITGDTKPDQLSDQQSIAILQLKKKRNELSNDELKYAASSGANAVMAGAYIASTASTTKQLTEQGKDLGARVPTAFTGMEAVKAPAASAGVTTSMDNLGKASARIPDVAQKLTRLGEGLRSLL